MTLVDSNILIDIWTEDPNWFEWSSAEYAKCLSVGVVAINPIIYSELSLGFPSEAELDSAIYTARIDRIPLPFKAAFSAGRAFLEYRKRGGVKTAPLPDFYIGAHAQHSGIPLLTRDPSGYQSYFPGLEMITP